MTKKQIKRYSTAFKMQVVREYEEGSSATKLMQKYGIGSARTINRWIKKYSLSGLRTEMMVIQTAEDHQEYQAMKQRIVELESALAEAVLENRMLKTTLDVASDALEMDIKKNFGKKSSVR